MGTLTSLMNLANAALQANQSALNATGNNVANQNTVGYTREIVNSRAVDSISIDGQSYGQGVTTGSGATSVRDRILEQRVQQQTQVVFQNSTIRSALTAVQEAFGLTATTTSAATTVLGSAIDSFFSSFATLEANPADPLTRQGVLSAATAFTNAFHSASMQIASQSSSLSSQVGSIVGQINALTADIAALNHQIASASPNSDAGTLEDQRQASIAQLSTLIGVDQVKTEQNGITLMTRGGAVLVSGGEAYDLKPKQVAGVTHVLAGPTALDVTASITGGSLGGVLEARDQRLPALVSSLDSLAYAIGTQVNTQNQAGLDGNGNPGAALFLLPATAPGTAGSITLATTDPKSLAAASIGEGSTGNGNALALARLSGGIALNGQTASGFYASILSQLGNSVASAISDNTVQQAALTQLTSQRDAISGVSLDQEAASLTQYQRSYQAAAKVFSIVNALMADAINLGTASAVN